MSQEKSKTMPIYANVWAVKEVYDGFEKVQNYPIGHFTVVCSAT